jgi:hypothetical protein
LSNAKPKQQNKPSKELYSVNSDVDDGGEDEEEEASSGDERKQKHKKKAKRLDKPTGNSFTWPCL